MGAADEAASAMDGRPRFEENMRPDTMYVLDESGNPVPCDDVIAWGSQFENKERRRVGYDEIGNVRVSTVFLGLDHSFGDGPPLLFETMIFGGPHDQFQERYSTRQEAIDGHNRALALVRGHAF